MTISSDALAKQFLEEEKQFHLGMLPTEQSNPKTANLDRIFAEDTVKGIQTLLSVDRDIAPMAKRVFASREYRKLADTITETVRDGGRVVFSGCGATGRLSILLESMWRQLFARLETTNPAVYAKTCCYADSLRSIMTGGDFAMIKSVESFEDFQAFGRRQVIEMNVTDKDVLVAITEGGETSSVLGTVAEAADRNARVFLLFNNPADVLCQYIERSRIAIEDPRVTVLDLFCGPMGIAGSTRMQATTSEQLVAGAALEEALRMLFAERLSPEEFEALQWKPFDYALEFDRMVESISTGENVTALADLLNFEADIYRQHGLVTYYAAGHLLDILTDTTERSPTFMLPPYKQIDDTTRVPSWAFVKDPLHTTREAWLTALGRDVRCLEWKKSDYEEMNAPASVIANPPEIGAEALFRFRIGTGEDTTRTERHPNAAIRFVAGSETGTLGAFDAAFDKAREAYDTVKSLRIGADPTETDQSSFVVNCVTPESPLRLIERLAVKLVLNTMSTGTMVMLGRVTGNWMSYVQVSNKKLRDRGIRLVAELCKVDYPTACRALHETMEEFANTDFSNQEIPSPVQVTIAKLGRKD